MPGRDSIGIQPGLSIVPCRGGWSNHNAVGLGVATPGGNQSFENCGTLVARLASPLGEFIQYLGHGAQADPVGILTSQQHGPRGSAGGGGNLAFPPGGILIRDADGRPNLPFIQARTSGCEGQYLGVSGRYWPGFVTEVLPQCSSRKRRISLWTCSPSRHP
jgi:hypothetical protein